MGDVRALRSNAPLVCSTALLLRMSQRMGTSGPPDHRMDTRMDLTPQAFAITLCDSMSLCVAHYGHAHAVLCLGL